MSSLTPAHALAYLRELSADFRAGIVVDGAGERLAGDPALHAPAQALLAAHPHAIELHGALDDRAQVFAIRAPGDAVVGSADASAGPGDAVVGGADASAGPGDASVRAPGRAIVVVTGPHALPSVMRRDLRTAVSGSTFADRLQGGSTRPARDLVEPLVTAAADAFRR